MALARHIQIAREDGPKAGFTAWMEMMERSGLPQVRERLAEVQAVGNKKAQFDYYCNAYGPQIFGNRAQQQTRTSSQGRTTVPASTEAHSTEDLFGLFAQFMQSVGAGNVQTEDTSLDDVDEDAIIREQTRTSGAQSRRSSGGQSRKSQSTRSNARTNNDDAFAPRNPGDNATSGRLWKLNQLGLLVIADNAGDPITNGEAHEVLKSLLNGG